jgi:ribosomal protein S18 acetylase RimI-like enzyme
VDSLNASGAVGLYERLGFRTTRIRTAWNRELPPVAPG